MTFAELFYQRKIRLWLYKQLAKNAKDRLLRDEKGLSPTKGPSRGANSQGLCHCFFAGPKTETLIYQCFYFAKTAKNAIFGSLLLRSAYNSDKWHFNAWFMLQLRGLVEFFLLVSGFILWRGWVVGWGLGSNFLILKGN